MKKKAYITPTLLVVNVAPQLMQTLSSASPKSMDDPTIDPKEDTDPEPYYSRSSSWDDDDDYDF